MSFLEPLLLALAGFAALPVLLHLIRRRRVRVLELPTFRFLKKAAMQQRFHLRIQDQLLMILRMLVLLLLGLAFAGPSTRTSSSPETAALGIKNVLLIDDSVSLDVRDSAGPSLFERAVEIAKQVLEARRGNWSAVLASDADRETAPLSFSISDSETLAERIDTRTRPAYSGPIQPLLEKVAAEMNAGEALWVLTDRTASNWSFNEEGNPRSVPVRALFVGETWKGGNWALSDLVVRNEPLFENEPALLSVSAEGYQADGRGAGRPRGLRYGWVDSEGESSSAEVPVSASGGPSLVLGTSVLVPAGIQTVTASLEFPTGEGDPLDADDQRMVVPKTLRGARVQVLAADADWRRLLRAALSGFEVEEADPSEPPPSGGSPRSATLLLLGGKAVSSEWIRLLRAQVEGGEGLLVLQEGEPEGASSQAWSEWWDAWECVSRESRAPAGAICLIAGENPWFDSALDSGARDPRWAERGFRAFAISGWSGEWFARAESGEEIPLFQTHGFGGGTVGVWTVPLSPSETGLVLSPGWVPLLSQMLKRTLIDPSALDEAESPGIPVRESDLRSLSGEQERMLAGRGIVSLDADKFIGEIENLPSTLHDWTVAILALCFVLALLEIGVSNSV